MPLYCNCEAEHCQVDRHAVGKRCSNRVAGGTGRSLLCMACREASPAAQEAKEAAWTPCKKPRVAMEQPVDVRKLVDTKWLLARRLRESGVPDDMQETVKLYATELTEKAQDVLGEAEVWEFARHFAGFFGRFAAKAGCPVHELLARKNTTLPEFAAALGHLSAAFVADPLLGDDETPPKVGPAAGFKAWCLTALHCKKDKVIEAACWILNIAEGSSNAD